MQMTLISPHARRVCLALTAIQKEMETSRVRTPIANFLLFRRTRTSILRVVQNPETMTISAAFFATLGTGHPTASSLHAIQWAGP
jgi:non-homologous end joining protein Ku